VELFINHRSLGKVTQPTDGCIFAFPNVAFEPGVIKAIGSSSGKVVCTDQIETAGAPTRLKLTAHTGPKGLQADGSDVALIDVEVVDAQGRRCPTDEARVDFAVDGPLVWRGGYNSGKPGSTNNLFLDTECGINRVSIRSTLKPGTITIRVTRNGLEPAMLKLESEPVDIQAGLEKSLPPRLGLEQ
ncbi:MAG TPA: DUF4982 domain-containing protein, partial [Opitutaceae bacterium]|nr:DUF4982 domain-containing protein [Opitutaceae bacterium]